MNKWFKNRKNQVTIVLLGVNIILVLNFILPGYEALPYYHRKINQLEKQVKILEKYSLHMPFHEEKYNEFKQNLQSLKQQIFKVRDTKHLQKVLGELQRVAHLNIITQKIENLNIDNVFDEVVVKQQLKGKYSDHMRYLISLTSPKTALVTSSCSFQNLNPTSSNPDLLMTLEFKYLLPKL